MVIKTSELRQLSKEKLNEELVNAQRELAKIRFHVQTGQEKDTAKIKKIRQVIARIITLQKEFQLNKVSTK